MSFHFLHGVFHHFHFHFFSPLYVTSPSSWHFNFPHYHFVIPPFCVLFPPVFPITIFPSDLQVTLTQYVHSILMCMVLSPFPIIFHPHSPFRIIFHPHSRVILPPLSCYFPSWLTSSSTFSLAWEVLSFACCSLTCACHEQVSSFFVILILKTKKFLLTFFSILDLSLVLSFLFWRTGVKKGRE